MTDEITDDDQGKSVVNADGDQLGMIEEVRHGTAYVNPDPGITDQIKTRLGWGDADEDAYPLQSERIETITSEEVRLGRDL